MRARIPSTSPSRINSVPPPNLATRRRQYYYKCLAKGDLHHIAHEIVRIIANPHRQINRVLLFTEVADQLSNTLANEGLKLLNAICTESPIPGTTSLGMGYGVAITDQTGNILMQATARPGRPLGESLRTHEGSDGTGVPERNVVWTYEQSTIEKDDFGEIYSRLALTYSHNIPVLFVQILDKYPFSRHLHVVNHPCLGNLGEERSRVTAEGVDWRDAIDEDGEEQSGEESLER